MMAIRQRGTTTTVGTIYPADRCSWVQTYDGGTEGIGHYEINGGMFYPGNAGAVALGDNIELGFVGKSGRFVPITEG